MMNKLITFKDLITYASNLIGGNYVPFLVNEINTEYVNEIIKNSKADKSNEKKNHKLELYNQLKKTYGHDRDLYLTSSGRGALYMILKNLNLSKNSEIIIPSYSCFGLIQPILSLKLTPHFIDVNVDLNPSFESVKKAINSNTKVVIVPHLGGTFASDLFEIMDFCKKRGICVIEDCCQAFGLKFKNKNVGLFADISFFSSGEGKPVFTPEGGWIVIKKKKRFKIEYLEEESEKISLRNFKKFNARFPTNYSHAIMNRLFEHFKSLLPDYDKIAYSDKSLKTFDYEKKLSNLAAALISFELRKIDQNLYNREKLAKFWIKNSKKNGLRFLNTKNSIFNKLFVESSFLQKKQLIIKGLQVENGYKPLHLRYDFDKYPRVDLNNTNYMWKKIYSLPVRPSLNINNII